MNTTLDTRRVTIFLVFAFGIAWAVGLIVYFSGGLVNSPVIVPGANITLALVLVAIGYMWAPALANIFTRLLTREGWRETGLRPRFSRGWLYWLAAWVLPAVFTIVGMVIFFGLFPQYYDPSLKVISNLLAQAGQPDVVDPWIIVIAQTVQAIIIAPFINSLFTFGEEFGWRAYLQPKLMPLGGHKAILLTGVIWGVWHWPIIAMGHNYGLDYPGAPWLGMLAMAWFTFTSGTFLGWATLRSGSVWPAVVGHAAINGISSLGVLLMQGEPSPLLGPIAVGVVAGLGWALMAGLLFLWPNALSAPIPESLPEPVTAVAPTFVEIKPQPVDPSKLDDTRFTSQV